MRILSETARLEDEGRKLLYFLRGRMKIGNRLLSSLKYKNQIFLNDLPTHVDSLVHAGDVIRVILLDEAPSTLVPQNEEVAICWEDEDFFAAEKSAPLACQQGHHQEPSLEARLLAHYGAGFVFRPLNRLDKGTSGLLIAAKNQRAFPLLQQRLHTDDFIREYLAVTEGFPGEAGVIDLPIARVENSVRRCVREDGLKSITEFRTLARYGHRSLVRLRLRSGRTHQIRVHLSHQGCPLTGDFLYGCSSDLLPGRFALHSAYVRFVHPLTQEVIELSSPLPAEMENLLKP